MKASEIDLVRRRLQNQQLARPEFRRPVDVVAWLGAAQAQDYPAAKWALGLRANGITDADVEQAFNDGAILRTHVLRPTWHFVTPADIRWMLALTGPRVNAVCASYYRKLGLDDRLLARSRTILERALRDGTQLTRSEIGAVLLRGGIAVKSQPLAFLVMRAELDQVICSGARRGKQFTYALLEERAPRARVLERDEALAELTRRYFWSHGPATLRDYVWWSGLTVREAKTGIDLVKPALASEMIGDRTYWFVPSRSRAPRVLAPSAYLLPNYDEYLIAYKDRGLVVAASRARNMGVADEFPHHIVIDGRLAGSWRRTLRSDSVALETLPYARLTGDRARALAAAAERYGRFVEMPVTLATPATS